MVKPPDLGVLCSGSDVRDAIHIAVAPVVAMEAIAPGDQILVENGTAHTKGNSFNAVADPFLQRGVKKGERFWALLVPNTVSSLRHYWEHPAFPNEQDNSWQREKDGAIQWLTDFAGECHLTYDDLVLGAIEYVETGDYLILRGYDTPNRVYSDNEKLWEMLKAVGVNPPHGKSNPFISCSC